MTNEQTIRDDLETLLHFYEFSRKIGVTMSTERVLESIKAILEKK